MASDRVAFWELMGEWVDARCDQLDAAEAGKVGAETKATRKMTSVFREMLSFSDRNIESSERKWLEYFEKWSEESGD